MNIRKLFLLMILTSTSLFSQENSILQNRYLLDFLSDNTSDYRVLLTEIEELANNPIYIEKLAGFNFENIPLVNYDEASIISHFVHSRKILSRHELLEIDNIPYEKLLYIINFLTDTPPSKTTQNLLSETEVHLRSRVYVDELTESISETRQYNRLLINGKNFGLTLHVDRLPGQNEYFKFYTAGFELKEIGILKHVVLGKYKFRFGKGLVINNSFPAFKDLHTLNRYSDAKSTTFKSVEENVQLEGFSIKLKVNNIFTIDAFYSNKMLYVDRSWDKLYFINQYNYLRSNKRRPTERIKEIITGGIATGQFNKNLSLSLMVASINYSATMFNQFGSINSITYISAGGEYKSKRVGLNFESGFSGKEFAAAITTEISPYKYLSFFTGYRIFTPQWYAPYGNVVSEYNDRNEKGIYFGGKFSSSFGIFYLFYDKYLKIRSESFTNRNESGSEYIFQYYSPRLGKLRINSKLTFEPQREPTDHSIFRTSFTGILDVNENFSVKLIGKSSNYSNNNSQPEKSAGWFFEQVNIFSPEIPLKFILSTFMFDLSSYDARIYVYSYGVPGAYNIVSQIGRGYGFNIVLQYSIIDTLELSINYRTIRKSYNGEKSSDTQLAFQFDLML